MVQGSDAIQRRDVGVSTDEDDTLQGRRERLLGAERSTGSQRKAAKRSTAASGRRDIGYIGRPNITADERELVYLLGLLLADSGAILHISDRSNASRDAIRAGYQAGHGICVEHASKIQDAVDTMILHTDDQFTRRVTETLPDWQSYGWLVIDTEEKLVRLCEAAMMFLDDPDSD